MKRATITLPDDLEADLNRYLAEQDVPPNLTTLMQAALREYLRNRGLQRRGYRPPEGTFKIDPVDEKDARGEPDVSVNHDRYLR